MTATPNDQPRQDDPHDPPDRFPEIDGYDIIDLVGVGGMGMVHEAIQRATGRRVAVKVMLERAMESPSARQRFEREVEFIARLDHPNIVAVLDSGVHDGQHYCVMDFVEGSSLDDAMTPGECDPRAALALIERIARAVDYAHQRGVLHRDLKPDNVLIDEQGEPHLLDFGLAKAIDPTSAMGGRQTISEPGQLIGTVAYMAPEQARGEIGELSVRTDVYALGAIAYELLTGKLPVDVTGSLGETLARLESRDAARPSSIRKHLGSDIDAILLKALEKDPASRYETAGALADDIQRWLTGFPVQARRIGPVDRMGRWVNRNRKVSAVTGAALVALLIVSSVAAIRIVDERNLTLMTQAEDAKMYKALDPDLVGREITVVELLQARAKELEKNPIGDPRIEVEVKQSLGAAFFRNSAYQEAERIQRRALELRERTGRGGNKALAISLHDLAGTLWHRGKYAQAAELYERALALRKTKLGEDHQDYFDTLANLAAAYDHIDRQNEALAIRRQALAVRIRIHGPDHDAVDSSKINLAMSLIKQDEFDEALALIRSAIENLRLRHQTPNRGLASSLTNLGMCLIEMERLDEARRALEESLKIKDSLVGKETETYAWSQYMLAKIAWMEGESEHAHDLAQTAADVMSRVLPDKHRKVALTRALLDEIEVAQVHSDERSP